MPRNKMVNVIKTFRGFLVFNLTAATMLVLFCSTLTSTAAEVKAAPKPETVMWDDAADTEENGQAAKRIIGTTEPVRIIPGDFVVTARIDTGANTTSLHADNLQIVNKDGKNWARFTLEGHAVDAKVIKFVHIKQHSAPSERRPVILLRLILGDVSESVKVTLTNRSNFKYKLLIGRNYLYDRFIVDVSLKNTSQPAAYEGL